MGKQSIRLIVLRGLLLLIGVGCLFAYVEFAAVSLWISVDRWSASPDWSPDGERIAFTCHYPSLFQVLEDLSYILDPMRMWLVTWGHIPQATEICTVYADGSHLARLTDNQVRDEFPVWSPDGQFIAYLSDGNAVYIMGKDGKQPRRISENLSARGHTWSPDGKQICFAARDLHQPKQQGLNIYCATLESGNIHALTTLPDDAECARWSPDGTRIAFVWFPEGFSEERTVIRVTDLAGNSYDVAEGFLYIDNLTWSPDGTRLAFGGVAPTDCEYHCREIFVADLSKHSVTCLTEQYEIDVGWYTTWSPVGERIAFIAREGNERAIYTVASNGQQLTRITPSDYYGNLTWAPDGTSIAFVRSPSGLEGDKLRIWIVEVEGGNLRELDIP
jgi:Tol biopolymer transport system component